jgi:signal peptidase I
MNPTYAAGDAIYADTTEEPDFYDVIVFYLPVSETRADNPALSKYTSNAFWRSMPFFGGKIPLGTDMNGWEILVKRVAGLPFDTVELRAETVDGENRVFLYRNGEKIDEDFNMYDETAITAEKSDAENPYFSLVSPMAAVKLGADEYFVLGDNRDDSRDGRSFGAVKKEYIFGTVRR